MYETHIQGAHNISHVGVIDARPPPTTSTFWIGFWVHEVRHEDNLIGDVDITCKYGSCRGP